MRVGFSHATRTCIGAGFLIPIRMEGKPKCS
nr:MAG TPA: hypothetical protein [Caudoviricetes sp.]DAW55188.1 MAG TPA: hypothetical protein [Caudoviricetes sp.]